MTSRRTLCIYNKQVEIDRIELSNDIFLYNGKIYLLYDGKVINPPFFNKIIIATKIFKKDDLRMLFNMLLIGGSIVFTKSKKIITKKSNIQYYFKNRIVEFIIMGTQKGGTTALAINISKHPDIYIDSYKDPRKSEIHFFDIYWYKGLDYYKKKFDYSKKLVGEKTPDLMYLSHTFPLIQSINPYIKIIIILRNPIHRAYSHWKLIKKYFGEKRTFEDAIDDELKNRLKENKTFYTAQYHYLQRGLYYHQIKELLKWFPRQNILILFSEHVLQDMNSQYNKVYEFLNLKKMDLNYEKVFESEDKSEINESLYNQLTKFYKKDVKKLSKLLDFKLNWF